MTMHCASIHRPAGHWPKEKATATLSLDFDARHRRRIRLTADQGEGVLLDLPKAVAMADGDGLQLEDGQWLKVRAATFSPELADLTIYVIDVAEGEKIPRKGGPGITRSDFLVINKIDLAPLVGANLKVMEADALRMRIKRPFIFTNLKSGEGVDQIASFVIEKGGLGAKERMSKNEDVERNGHVEQKH
jgi:hypothetical protein